uniref:Uncharacterized protein n=1 Tax=Micrurus surinamensis TaxID=129470 RepID=A0A2D4NV09_MICSU
MFSYLWGLGSYPIRNLSVIKSAFAVLSSSTAMSPRRCLIGLSVTDYYYLKNRIHYLLCAKLYCLLSLVRNMACTFISKLFSIPSKGKKGKTCVGEKIETNVGSTLCTAFYALYIVYYSDSLGFLKDPFLTSKIVL